MNICLIHFEGGEISGSIDEHLRHCITKLSNYHFVSNEIAQKRVIQMGENPDCVFNVGCPLSDIIITMKHDKARLKNINNTNFNVNEKDYLLALYHPVTTDIELCLNEYNILLTALEKIDKKVILYYPNSDNGSKELIRLIHTKSFHKNQNFLLVKNLEVEVYLTLLFYCACIVGNSSSGVRESCIYGVPAIDIGDRQKGRDKANNTYQLINLKNQNQLVKIINSVYGKRFDPKYLYGDGNAIAKISKILNNLDFKAKKSFYEQE